MGVHGHRRGSVLDRVLQLGDGQVRVLLLLLALLLYGRSLTGDYVFDDAETIVRNQDAQCEKWSDFGEVWRNDFWGNPLHTRESHKSYRPITTITFRLVNCLPSIVSLPLQHLVNVCLHAMVCIFLFSALQSLLPLAPRRVHIVAVILFALHPVHVESVANVSGRAELLSALCYLAVIHWSNTQPSNLALIYCVTVVGVLCKEQCITVLLVISLVDLLHGRPLRRLLLHGIVLFTICYARMAMTDFTAPKFSAVDNPSAFHPHLHVRVVNYVYIYIANTQLLLAPFWLCFDWSMGCIPLITDMGGDPRMVLIVLLPPLIAATLILYTNVGVHWHSILLGVVLTVAPFLPSSNALLTVGFVLAERVLYLPSMGICLLLALLVDRLGGRPMTHLLLPIYMAALAYKTMHRCAEWGTELSLYSSALDVCPGNAKVHYNVAKVRGDRGDARGAEHSYRHALSLHPSYEQAMNNLATMLLTESRPSEALPLLLAAVRLRPTFATAWMNLGIAHANLGQYWRAERAYDSALRLRHGQCPDCHYNLGNLHLAKGAHYSALAAWNNCTIQSTQHGRAWLNKLVLLDELDEVQTCIDEGHTAMHVLQGQHDEVSAAMATCLARGRNYESAREILEGVIDRCAGREERSVHLGNLAVVYHRWGRLREARETYAQALRANPQLSIARQNLRLLANGYAQ